MDTQTSRNELPEPLNDGAASLGDRNPDPDPALTQRLADLRVRALVDLDPLDTDRAWLIAQLAACLSRSAREEPGLPESPTR